MPKRKRRLAILWQVPDGLWERIEPLLNEADPPKPRGRHRVDRRRVLDGIIFRLESVLKLSQAIEIAATTTQSLPSQAETQSAKADFVTL